MCAVDKTRLLIYYFHRSSKSQRKKERKSIFAKCIMCGVDDVVAIVVSCVVLGGWSAAATSLHSIRASNKNVHSTTK